MEKQALAKMTSGGGDNRYRKLCGLGEYANKNRKGVRSTNKGEQDSGEYP